MNKKDMIVGIEHAREAHIEQIEKVASLIEGEYVRNLTPISKKKCEFGHWLYGDEERMKKILGEQFYENLDIIHENWHIIYAKIYVIFIREEEGGFFSKIFKRHKISPLEYEKAKVYYKDLERITDDLLRLLDASQRRVLALNESKFA